MSYLKTIRACESGQEWADGQADYKTAWDTCERGDWMIWIASKQLADNRKLTGAKAECAGLVEHLMKDERSVNAVRVAERFGRGEATEEELRVAADAAYAAAAYAAAYAADAYAYADARKETLKKCADIVRKWVGFDDLKIEGQQ